MPLSQCRNFQSGLNLPEVSALSKSFAADLADVVPHVQVDHLDVLLLVDETAEPFAALGTVDVLVSGLVNEVATLQGILW